MSDTSSVTSHMTKSHGDLSADDFSDSDYDLGDSGSVARLFFGWKFLLTNGFCFISDFSFPCSS
jgi:hypothetical protein